MPDQATSPRRSLADSKSSSPIRPSRKRERDASPTRADLHEPDKKARPVVECELSSPTRASGKTERDASSPRAALREHDMKARPVLGRERQIATSFEDRWADLTLKGAMLLKQQIVAADSVWALPSKTELERAAFVIECYQRTLEQEPGQAMYPDDLAKTLRELRTSMRLTQTPVEQSSEGDSIDIDYFDESPDVDFEARKREVASAICVVALRAGGTDLEGEALDSLLDNALSPSGLHEEIAQLIAATREGVIMGVAAAVLPDAHAVDRPNFQSLLRCVEVIDQAFVTHYADNPEFGLIATLGWRPVLKALDLAHRSTAEVASVIQQLLKPEPEITTHDPWDNYDDNFWGWHAGAAIGALAQVLGGTKMSDETYSALQQRIVSCIQGAGLRHGLQALVALKLVSGRESPRELLEALEYRATMIACEIPPEIEDASDARTEVRKSLENLLHFYPAGERADRSEHPLRWGGTQLLVDKAQKIWIVERIQQLLAYFPTVIEPDPR